MIRQFRHWCDIAMQNIFRLAIKTGYPDSVKEFVRLIQEIDHSHVGATIDVEHQKNYTELLARVNSADKGTTAGIRAYNDLTHEITDHLGPRSFHFHIHDIEPGTWVEHKPLIHGFVDYPGLLRKLKKTKLLGVADF